MPCQANSKLLEELAKHAKGEKTGDKDDDEDDDGTLQEEADYDQCDADDEGKEVVQPTSDERSNTSKSRGKGTKELPETQAAAGLPFQFVLSNTPCKRLYLRVNSHDSRSILAHMCRKRRRTD